MGGWVKNHRSIETWKYYKKPAYAHLWQHMLRQVHHDDKPTYDGHANKIEKGQFSTGILRLAKETGVNRGTVDRVLQLLENENQIVRQRTNKCSIITIVNWDKYQSREAERDSSVTQTCLKREQNKKGKNVKNEKKKKTAAANYFLCEELNQWIGTITDATMKRWDKIYSKDKIEEAAQEAKIYYEMKGYSKKSKSLYLNNWFKNERKDLGKDIVYKIDNLLEEVENER